MPLDEEDLKWILKDTPPFFQPTAEKLVGEIRALLAERDRLTTDLDCGNSRDDCCVGPYEDRLRPCRRHLLWGLNQLRAKVERRDAYDSLNATEGLASEWKRRASSAEKEVEKLRAIVGGTPCPKCECVDCHRDIQRYRDLEHQVAKQAATIVAFDHHIKEMDLEVSGAIHGDMRPLIRERLLETIRAMQKEVVK